MPPDEVVTWDLATGADEEDCGRGEELVGASETEVEEAASGGE